MRETVLKGNCSEKLRTVPDGIYEYEIDKDREIYMMCQDIGRNNLFCEVKEV